MRTARGYLVIVIAAAALLALTFSRERAAAKVESAKYTLAGFSPTREYRAIEGNWLLSYDGSRRCCAWTLEKLPRNAGRGEARRDGLKFHKDPFVPDEFASSPDDYNGFTHEFDRGHCAAAQYHNGSDDLIYQTFTIANTIVQTKGVNEQIWKHLEEYVLSLNTNGAHVWVATMPVWAPDGYPKSWEDRDAKFTVRSIGSNHQHIPPYCGKSVLVERGDALEVYAWLIPNDERCAKDDFNDYRVSVDQLEEVWGGELWRGIANEKELEKVQ